MKTAFTNQSQLQTVLRVRADGTLFCHDGRDVKEYLAAWAKHSKATEDTPINIMRHDSHAHTFEDAWMLRNFAS